MLPSKLKSFVARRLAWLQRGIWGKRREKSVGLLGSRMLVAASGPEEEFGVRVHT